MKDADVEPNMEATYGAKDVLGDAADDLPTGVPGNLPETPSGDISIETQDDPLANENDDGESPGDSGCSACAASLAEPFVGLLFILLAVVFSFQSEKVYLETQTCYEQLSNERIDIANVNKIDRALDGKITFLSGYAKTKDIVADPVFNIRRNGFNIRRTVEYFQWTESEYEDDDHTTQYSYSKDWVSEPVDSSYFDDRSHYNYTVFDSRESSEIFAKNGNVGSYKLADWQIKKIDEPVDIVDLKLTNKSIQKLRGEIKIHLNRIRSSEKYHYYANEFDFNIPNYIFVAKDHIYIGKNPNEPNIGDVRYTFSYTPQNKEISLAAQQKGDSFVEVNSGECIAAGPLLMLSLESKDFFQAIRTINNQDQTWERVIYLVLSIIGSILIFNSIGTFIYGPPKRHGLLIVVMTGTLGLFIGISILFTAWLLQRPLIAFFFFTFLVLFIINIFRLRKKFGFLHQQIAKVYINDSNAEETTSSESIDVSNITNTANHDRHDKNQNQ